jgi:hypothetical protein
MSPSSNGVNGHAKDAGFESELREAKPCCKRITHEGVSRFETAITWCLKPNGHLDPCEGPEPTVIDNSRGRRR